MRVISERLEIPIDKLADIALENAKVADPNVKIVPRNWRTVNGLRLLVLEMEATVASVVRHK